MKQNRYASMEGVIEVLAAYMFCEFAFDHQDALADVLALQSCPSMQALQRKSADSSVCCVGDRTSAPATQKMRVACYTGTAAIREC